ncbi:MAG TPA: hypothetical protein VN193_04785 [Candidatus Angelobacter sp.]|jgi:hypothetical protein|nr:hypothetical protein [Candidatus Angelobacter sp.]
MKAISGYEFLGPMGAACRDIRSAGERFAAARAAERGAVSLLRRSDSVLATLEELNVRGVKLVPDLLLSRLAALMADLPFPYPWRMGSRLSATAAIEVVFDIQDGLLRSMRGAQPDDDVELDLAS